MKTVALVGFGRWGKNLARNFHELGVLYGIYDEIPLEIPYEGVKQVSSFLEDPKIEQVVIATPATTHFSIAKEALLAGKDVFVEKPLCLTSFEAEELIEIAKEKQLILMVGHLLSYHPALIKLEELVKEDFFGTLSYISSHRLNFAPLREEHVHWDLGPHDLTLLFGLTKQKIKNVSFEGASTLSSSIIDTALMSLEFEGGLKSHIHWSWVSPFKEVRLVVIGQKGVAVFDDTKPWEEKLKISPLSLTPYGMPPLESVSLTSWEPLRAECEHFLQCCKTRQKPKTDGEHALKIIQTLEKAGAFALC
jgi:UDP-2-acetamido-3-amino-2,3-dideoxy-glucuronate N-acetyltransferase